MHGLRRRADAESGIIGMILALFIGAGIFIALGALVIDIGATQIERRQLQNGAEAAAMAASYECAMSGTGGNICGNRATAITMASRNARDGASNVVSGALCGAGNAGLLSCTGTRDIRHCPNTPTTSRWTQVTASTLTSGGSTYLPQFFAQYVRGVTPQTIAACAQAAWGPPASATEIMTPFAISGTCWQAQVAGASSYGPTTWSGTAARQYETVTTSTFTNSSSPSAAASICGTSTPGGFGSLGTISNNSCTVSGFLASPYSNWLGQQSGNSIPCPDVSAMLGHVVNVPIFDCAYQVASGVATATGYQYDLATNSFGTPCQNLSVTAPNGIYFRVVGMAAYFFGGYDFGGSSVAFYSPVDNPISKTTEPSVCKASQNCIFGWYTRQALTSSVNIDDTAPNFGLSVVKLVG